jgi:hypothetical protein
MTSATNQPIPTTTLEAAVDSRPEGKACRRRTTTASGAVARTEPTAMRAGDVVLARLAPSHANPPPTMSAPIRLLGRRHHASSPAVA